MQRTQTETNSVGYLKRVQSLLGKLNLDLRTGHIDVHNQKDTVQYSRDLRDIGYKQVLLDSFERTPKECRRGSTK